MGMLAQHGSRVSRVEQNRKWVFSGRNRTSAIYENLKQPFSPLVEKWFRGKYPDKIFPYSDANSNTDLTAK